MKIKTIFAYLLVIAMLVGSFPIRERFVYAAGSGLNYASKNAMFPSAAVFNNELYAAWSETNGTVYQIRVKKWNGSAWVSADNNAALNYNAAKNASDSILSGLSMVVYSNELYLFWDEKNAAGSAQNIRAKKWNGTAWVTADGNAALNYNAAKQAYAPWAAVYNGALYVAWDEFNGTAYQTRVKKWDGASWSSADGGAALNYDASKTAFTPTMIASNGELFAAWFETNGTVYQIRAKKWNGSAWVSADGNAGLNYALAKDASSGTISLAVFNAELYAMWSEDGGTVYQIRVKKWNGTAWVATDGNATLNYNAAKGATGGFLNVFNNELYAVWSEDNGTAYQIRSKKWNGTAWATADGNAALNYDAAKTAFPGTLQVFSNQLYAFWKESDGTNDIVRAKKWNNVSWATGEQPTSPSAPTGLNAIAGDSVANLSWTANQESNLASYKIYKNGGYLATVAAPATNYAATGLANGTSYSFRVAALDAEGNESAQSSTATALPLSADADLSSLLLSSGTMAPNFSPATTSYAATVANGVSSIAVTPAFSDPNATAKVNGNAVANGATSAPIPLSIGSNAVTVTTLAQNGTATKTYSIAVTRTPNTVPPTAPSNVRVAPSGGQAVLSWVANSEPDLAFYKIYKNGAYLATVAPPATTYAAAGLVNGLDYSFSATASNTSGYESAQSASANVISLGELAVKAPTVSADFGNSAIVPVAVQKNATLSSLTVSDATGLGSGWRLSLKASQFAEIGGAGYRLPMNSLAISPPAAITAGGGTSSPPPKSGILAPTTIDGGSMVTILSAAAGEGEGGYAVSFPANGLTLTIDPAGMRVDLSAYPSSPTVYQSVLTWSIVSGP